MKPFKKWQACGVLCLLIALFFPVLTEASATKPQANPVQQKKQLRTIIVADYYPYTFVNKNGLPDGFSVDLARAVTTVMGMEMEIAVDTWERARQQLKTGEIDLLPMMAYSEERDRYFDFSAPHTIAYDAFFTRKDGAHLITMEDVRGKTVVVMKNDQAHDFLQTSGLAEASHIITVDSLPEALRLLAAGNGDAALMPKLVGLMLIHDLHLNNLTQSPVVVESYNRPFSLAVREGNLPLLERLEQGLAIVQKTGQYRDIHAKWFGAYEESERGIPHPALKYLAGLLVVLFVIGSSFALWSFSLRKQVAASTRVLEEEIAERRRTEATLIASEARLAEAQRIAGLGCWEWIIADNRLWWSDETFRIFGIAPDMFVATFENFIAAVHPDDREPVRDAIAKALRHDEAGWRLDYRIVRPDGGIRFVHEEGRTEFDHEGRAVKRVGTVQDVTDRKRAEEALRKSKEAVRMRERMLNESQRVGEVGGWDWDSVNDVIWWSDEYYRIYGFAPGTPPPNYLEHLKAYTPESAERLDAAVKRAMECGEPYELDLELAAPTPKTHWIVARCEVKRDENGSIVGLRGTAQNITERKLAEEKLKLLNEQLDQRVRERTAELEAKNAELEQMNRLFVGRELKMIELKERIRELEKRNGMIDLEMTGRRNEDTGY